MAHLPQKNKLKQYPVRIPWCNTNGDIAPWDAVCVWTLETFGLPGDRFTTHPTENYMDFVFYNKQDAEIFALRWI
jgi:hypothetical protein